MMLTLMLQLWLTQAGCTKDTDCKGDRICEAGVCVSPRPPADLAAPALSAPPPPPVPPPVQPPPAQAPRTPRPMPTARPPSDEWPKVVRRDGLVCVQTPGLEGRIEESCRPDQTPPAPPTDEYPKVVRRDGLICVQSLTDEGRVTESCRAEGEDRVVAPPMKRRGRARGESADVPQARGRFVMDFLLQGGLAVLMADGLSVPLPQFTGQLAFGGRTASGLGFVGVGQLQVMGNAGLLAIIGTVAPGLRFGDRSHFTLAAGASYAGFSGIGGSGSGVMGSILAQGVIAVANAFGLTLHGGLHFDASGLMLTLGAGFGFGAF